MKHQITNKMLAAYMRSQGVLLHAGCPTWELYFAAHPNEAASLRSYLLDAGYADTIDRLAGTIKKLEWCVRLSSDSHTTLCLLREMFVALRALHHRYHAAQGYQQNSEANEQHAANIANQRANNEY